MKTDLIRRDPWHPCDPYSIRLPISKTPWQVREAREQGKKSFFALLALLALFASCFASPMPDHLHRWKSLPSPQRPSFKSRA